MKGSTAKPQVVREGDCTYYPTGWKYKVKNTGATPGKFLYFMSSPPGLLQRFE